MSRLGIRAAALLIAASALAACSSLTTITESWKAPGTASLHFQKVVVLALVRDEAARRVAEDALQAKLVGVPTVQSYKVLGPEDYRNKERAKGRLREDGFDGVVALRVVSSEQHATGVPGGYSSFWGYYDAFYPPMDLRLETVVRVEINVYSLTEDKLLWAGRSETLDPQSITQLISEIVAAADKELRKQGLIS
jgi:hypothetical protein